VLLVGLWLDVVAVSVRRCEQEQVLKKEFERSEVFSGAQTGGLSEWRVSCSLQRLADGSDIFIPVDVTNQFILSSPVYELCEV